MTDHIDALIAGYLDGLLDQEALSRLSHLLVRDPAVARRFAEATWVESDLITCLRLQQYPLPVGLTRNQLAARRRPQAAHRRWIAMAAAAVLLVTLPLLWLVLTTGARPSSSTVVVGVITASRSGDGRVDGPDGRYRPAKGKLHDGESLTTGDEPLSLALAGDIGDLRLDPRTRISVHQRSDGLHIDVVQGGLSAVVRPQPPEQPLRFTTATTEAVVLGTTLRFYAFPDGAALEVQTGHVAFRRIDTGEQVHVLRGQRASTGADGGFRRSSDGPPATVPVWAADSAVRAYHPAPDVTWSALRSDGSRTWRTLSREADMATPVNGGWFSVDLAALDLRQTRGLLLRLRGNGSGRMWMVEVFDGEPSERFVANLVDERAGWQELYLPFSAFVRRPAVAQHANAPDDGLGLMPVVGFSLITASGQASLDLQAIEAVMH